MNDIIKLVDNIEEHKKWLSEQAINSNTQKAYNSDMRQFEKWLTTLGLELPIESETLNNYLVYLDSIGLKPATIRRKMTTINRWHTLQDIESPVTNSVRFTNQRIRRARGTAQRQVKPLTWAALNRVLKFVPGNAIGIRDRALFLLGFAGAFRRSELVAINQEDISFVDEGMLIRLHRHKTDQESAGIDIPIPFIDVNRRCPVKAVQHLIAYNQQETGPIFFALGSAGRKLLGVKPKKRLSGTAVARIVKRYVEKAGYDPADYSGHSLRAGFATSASQAGLQSTEIMEHTRHKSINILMKYVRAGRQFSNHPLSVISAFESKN